MAAERSPSARATESSSTRWPMGRARPFRRPSARFPGPNSSSSADRERRLSIHTAVNRGRSPVHSCARPPWWVCRRTLAHRMPKTGTFPSSGRSERTTSWRAAMWGRRGPAYPATSRRIHPCGGRVPPCRTPTVAVFMRIARPTDRPANWYMWRCYRTSPTPPTTAHSFRCPGDLATGWALAHLIGSRRRWTICRR